MNYLFLLSAILLFSTGCASETPTLDIALSDKEVSYESGTLALSISSSSPWKLVCDDWWLTFPTTSGEKGSSELTGQIKENHSPSERTLNITVSAGGLEKSCSVHQAAAPVNPNPDPEPDPDPNPDPNPDPDPEPYTEYTRSGLKKMKLMGFWGPGGEEKDKTITPEKYREMAQCGFTLSLTKFFSVEDIKKSAAASDGTGVQLIIGLWTVTEDNIKAIKNLPQIYGYYLKDEPSVDQMASVKEQYELYKRVDPTRMCYVNLLPIHARTMFMGVDDYNKYISEYLKYEIPLLSYDFYSISGEAMDIHPQYYEALDLMSGIGRQTGYPVWTFVLSYNHRDYPSTESTMRFQAWAGLAYGSDCIEYYTYLTPDKAHGTGLLDTHYLRTERWDQVRMLNAEIQGLADVFVDREVIKVRGIGYSATGLPLLGEDELPSPFKSIHCGLKEGLLLSHFKNGDAEYVMLLNLNIKDSQSIALEFEEGKEPTEFVVDRQFVSQFKTHPASKSRMLPPGDMALYRIK